MFVMNGNDCPCGATSTFCALVWRTNSQDKGHSKLMPWFVKLFVSNSFHCCVFSQCSHRLPFPFIFMWRYPLSLLCFKGLLSLDVVVRMSILKYPGICTIIRSSWEKLWIAWREFLNIFMLMGHYFILKIGYFYMCLALSQIPDGVNITVV